MDLDCIAMPQRQLSVPRRNFTVVRNYDVWHLEVEESMVYVFLQDSTGVQGRENYVAFHLLPPREDSLGNLELSNITEAAFWNDTSTLVVPFTALNRAGQGLNGSLILDFGVDSGNIKFNGHAFSWALSFSCALKRSFSGYLTNFSNPSKQPFQHSEMYPPQRSYLQFSTCNIQFRGSCP